MPMLNGRDPFKPEGSNITIRKDVTGLIKQGTQVLWTSENGGHGIWAGWIGPCPQNLVGKFDNIILHEMDYEAAKKSAMEAPMLARKRRKLAARKRTDLQGFDAEAHFKKRYLEEQEHKAKLTGENQ